MKTKLLLTLLSSIFFFNSFAQQEASSYLSGLVEPSAIINQGNMLYIQGYNNLYQVDTTLPTPVATSIYSPATNFYMTNMTISGSIIYIAEENYDLVADIYLGSRIITLDTNNLSAPINVIYTTTQYISSLAIKDGFIYFASETNPDINDDFIVQIYKIDSNITNPSAMLLVSNLCASEEANDMAFYSNNLLISVGGLGKVFGFDTTDAVIVVSEYLNNLNFNKGLCVNNNSLFLSDGNLIGTKQLNSASSLSYVAQNTTYQDTNNGISFNANFRDVILIGDKIYMTLLDQGRVVTVQDAGFLTTNEFASTTISIHNSQKEVVVSGLREDQKATLYNLSGQLLTVKNLSLNDNSIDITLFSEGIYILKLDNQNTFKFIK
jgi:hypothetical protein